MYVNDLEYCQLCMGDVFLKIVSIFVIDFFDIGMPFTLFVLQKLIKFEYKKAIILSTKK